MRLLKNISFLALLSMVVHPGFAQQPVSDCEQVLTTATDEFNAGRFYSIAAILKPCMDRGFTREQRQRANLLLTQTYLLLDDPIGAETSYINVLWANPEFEADTARDPIDVVYLSRKFTADPLFSIFLKIGGNTSPVRVIHEINPSGEADVDNQYILRVGWQIGAGLDWNIMPDLALSAELNYASTAYRKQQIKWLGDEEDFVSRQSWLNVPVAVKYSDTKGKIRPFGYVGFAIQVLLSDRGQIALLKKDIINEQTTAIPNESPQITLTKYRSTLNHSFFIGGGARYKIGLDFVFADLRYGFGLTNLVVPATTFDANGPMAEWGHVDDYFRMDNLSISIGYVKPLYKPRKLKHARTRSVLRGINKSAR